MHKVFGHGRLFAPPISAAVTPSALTHTCHSDLLLVEPPDVSTTIKRSCHVMHACTMGHVGDFGDGRVFCKRHFCLDIAARSPGLHIPSTPVVGCWLQTSNAFSALLTCRPNLCCHRVPFLASSVVCCQPCFLLGKTKVWVFPQFVAMMNLHRHGFQTC